MATAKVCYVVSASVLVQSDTKYDIGMTLFSVTFQGKTTTFWCDLFYCELIHVHANERLKLAEQNNKTVTCYECFQQCYQTVLLAGCSLATVCLSKRHG